MKKHLFLTGILFLSFFPAAAAGEPAPAARAMLSYADDVILSAQEAASGYAREMSGQVRSCLNAYGWETLVGSRVRLGYADFKESVAINKSSACLLRDTARLETRIMQLVRIVSDSEIACVAAQADFYRDQIERLFFLRDALAEYADLTPEDEQRAWSNGKHPLQEFADRFGELPPQLRQTGMTLSHETYRSDELCTEPSSFFGFHQLKREFEALLYRLQEIGKFTDQMRGVARSFSAGETPSMGFGDELETIRKEAKRDSDAWFYENITQPISDNLYFGFGSTESRMVTKNKEEAAKQAARDAIRISDAIPSPRPLAEVAKDYPIREDTHTVMREEKRRLDDSEAYLKMVSEQLVFMTEVSRDISESTLEAEVADLAPLTKELRDFYEEVNRLTREICAQHGSCE